MLGDVEPILPIEPKRPLPSVAGKRKSQDMPLGEGNTCTIAVNPFPVFVWLRTSSAEFSRIPLQLITGWKKELACCHSHGVLMKNVGTEVSWPSIKKVDAGVGTPVCNRMTKSTQALLPSFKVHRWTETTDLGDCGDSDTDTQEFLVVPVPAELVGCQPSRGKLSHCSSRVNENCLHLQLLLARVSGDTGPHQPCGNVSVVAAPQVPLVFKHVFKLDLNAGSHRHACRGARNKVPLVLQQTPQSSKSATASTQESRVPGEGSVSIAMTRPADTCSKQADSESEMQVVSAMERPFYCSICKKSTRNAQTATIPLLKGGLDVAVGTNRSADRELCKSTQVSLKPFTVDWCTNTEDLEDSSETYAHRGESPVPSVYGSSWLPVRDQSCGVATVCDSQLARVKIDESAYSSACPGSTQEVQAESSRVSRRGVNVAVGTPRTFDQNLCKSSQALVVPVRIHRWTETSDLEDLQDTAKVAGEPRVPFTLGSLQPINEGPGITRSYSSQVHEIQQHASSSGSKKAREAERKRQQRVAASPGRKAREAERKRQRRVAASPGAKAREVERRRHQRAAASPGAKAREAERRRQQRGAMSPGVKAREAERRRQQRERPFYCSKCKKSTRNAQTVTIPPLKGGLHIAIETNRSADRELCKSTQASFKPVMVDWSTNTEDLEDSWDTDAHRGKSPVPSVYGSSWLPERNESCGVATVHNSQLDRVEIDESTYSSTCPGPTQEVQAESSRPSRRGVDVAVGTPRISDQNLCKSSQASVVPVRIHRWTETSDLEDLQDTAEVAGEPRVPFAQGSLRPVNKGPGITTSHSGQVDVIQQPASSSGSKSPDAAAFSSRTSRALRNTSDCR
ncbi:hypothetical protein MTO96_026558 [Rhipicephalus appendiculatus]